MRYTLLLSANVAVALGTSAYGIGAVGGDGYYDGFYGPFEDGYWGADGVFWYHRDHAWHRDDGHHFRRDAASGFLPVRGRNGPAKPGLSA